MSPKQSIGLFCILAQILLMKIQFQLKRTAEEKLQFQIACPDLWQGYISDYDFEGFKKLMNEWETPNGTHKLNSPVLEVELIEKK
jgi:hypothetical protein